MKLFLSLILLFIIEPAISQDRFYAYTEDWSNTTDLKKATFFMEVVKENDSSYVCRYYNMYGPMIKLETYTDEALTRPVGRFIWFNEKGTVDSTGFVYEGKKDRHWRYYTNPDSSSPAVTESYDRGKFLFRIDHLNKRTTNSAGVVLPSELPGTDSVDSFVTTQKAAEFPNGIQGWRKYLERNFETPGRFRQSVRGHVKATVIIAFTVDVNGNISDVFPLKSVEWSLDTAVERLFRKGPRWIPAEQNGKKVSYFQRQAVTVLVDEE